MNPEPGREQQFMESVAARLDRRFGAARMPATVKQKEAPYHPRDEHTKEGEDIPTTGDFRGATVSQAPIRLNSAWYDLTQEQGKMTPATDVKYLWVIREDGHLILGVEDPSSSPHAFHKDPPNTHGDGLGHPSLAATFTETGVLQPGAGRIGGELFQDGGRWVINDHSGRYGKGREMENPTALLTEAAREFRSHGIDVNHIQSKSGGDAVVPVKS